MEKKTIYMIIAVVVVLAFLLEQVAIGALTSHDTGNAQANATAGSSLTGKAYTNVTISGYEPYIIVSGNSTRIAEIKQELIAEGIATYAVPSGNSWIINLQSSKSVVPSAMLFEAANATVLATAMITMPPTVAVASGTQIAIAEGTGFSLQMRPVYEEGSVEQAYFMARVDNGVITGIGTLSILPSLVKGAQASAEVVSQPEASYAVEVAWQDRAAAKKAALASGASYKEKSYISISENATQEALAAAAAKPYVTAVQAGILSVANSFADMENSSAQLLALGLSPSFPASVASFANQTSNQSAILLLENLTAEGMNATLASQSRMKVLLPASIEKGGRAYYLPEGIRGLWLEASGPWQNATNATAIFDFQANGNSVTSIVAGSARLGES